MASGNRVRRLPLAHPLRCVDPATSVRVPDPARLAQRLAWTLGRLVNDESASIATV